jgi:hypothetical protein
MGAPGEANGGENARGRDGWRTFLDPTPFFFLLELGPQQPFFQIGIGKAQQSRSTVTVNFSHRGSPPAVGELSPTLNLPAAQDAPRKPPARV